VLSCVARGISRWIGLHAVDFATGCWYTYEHDGAKVDR